MGTHFWAISGRLGGLEDPAPGTGCAKVSKRGQGRERGHTKRADLHPKCDVVLPLVAIATPIEYTRNPLKVFELDFEENLRIVRYCVKYNRLNEDVILDIVKGNPPKELKIDDAIIYGVNGKPIQARSANQQKLVKAFNENDLTFALGPAGTGKTYVAIALAVKALKNREIRKVILSRPAVEAGEKLGFLPGDMKDKIDPYLQPLYDALEDMIPTNKLKEYMETNVIQIAPLAFMRGRTLSDAVIILDEAQNTTTHQIKMFLTRLGMNAKMVVTGDITQIDLPHSQTSGLVQALNVLHGVPGIAKVQFDKKDIVRHQLVQRIVEAYEKHDEAIRKLRTQEKE